MVIFNMDKKELTNKIIVEIWELKRRIRIWNFIYGKESSQEKLNEFIEYFTEYFASEFQEALKTKILVDLRAIVDKSNDDVTSIYKVIDANKLKDLERIFFDLRRFINTAITHKNYKVEFSFTFKNIGDTLIELEKLISEEDKDVITIWEVNHFDYDLGELYNKVKRVNEWEQSKKPKRLNRMDEFE